MYDSGNVYFFNLFGISYFRIVWTYKLFYRNTVLENSKGAQEFSKGRPQDLLDEDAEWCVSHHFGPTPPCESWRRVSAMTRILPRASKGLRPHGQDNGDGNMSLPDDPRTSSSRSGPNSTRANPAVTTKAPEIGHNVPKRTSDNPQNLPRKSPRACPAPPAQELRRRIL